ncbi:uncharacterized protein RHIMIDRAFT_242258 [Rhizopus microsporus ATCC 52813]|uniref:Uncharacterized protein n=1 Tax=Rhizopus microsporus ATCC 52813 TaxID=1340429 RepID=A0A2G4SHP1_RHIZD|nr:uncharacterized protein RHIMIDRAFT_242258 [Rhizopus microsporus ATCC 52813]PHZ07906.1 hypothetical protein RHIMIDRAFT_242258 [Rhizopus microsporus ATCC 52813]
MTDDPPTCPYLGLLKASYLHGHTPPTWTTLSSLDIFLIIRGIAQWMCKLGRVVEGLLGKTRPILTATETCHFLPMCQMNPIYNFLQITGASPVQHE